MVAQPQSSSTRPAPLSYADRARNHSKNETLPPKPTMNGASANSLSPPSSSGPSKPTAAIKVSSPNPRLSPNLSAPSMRQPTASNSSARSTETNSTLSVNGHPPTTNGHPPSTPETTTPLHPPVNVWDKRKEQMAQSQATQRGSVIPPAKDPPPSVASQNRDPNTSSGLRDGSVSLRSISTNGASTITPENDDPFIVKHNTSPNPIPPVEDKESWPEVGSSVTGNHSKERVERAAKPPQDSSKKEKRKWVPVPPEMQATADALQPRHHRVNTRNRSQSRNNDNSANASSGSGEVSQRSSRPHSVRTSASHSRVSSRTGSVHTSPRFNPANRTLYDTPEVLPPIPYPEPLHNPQYLHPNPPVDNSMNNPYAYSYSPAEGSSTSSPSQHYYSASAGYDNPPLPPPPQHSTGLPHFHHVPHYQQQLGSGNTYPHLSQPIPHRPSDPAINFAPLTPAQDSGQGRIPSLTKSLRPPPPEHSAPVDGYRNITVALFADSSGQQLTFGRIQPQSCEENANPPFPGPELVPGATDENPGNILPGSQLPPFTVGVGQDDLVVASKGTGFQSALKIGVYVPVGDSTIGGITDRTNPETTFQFGTFPPLDIALGSGSEQSGALSQGAPVELDSLKSDTGDEWQVRDFGYGFGHMSGTGNAAAVIRDEINAREQQRVQERRQREEQERRQKEEQERENSEPPQDRVRRGSVNGGYERGPYRGGRGRGLNGGFGRGYGRNFSRGGYSQYPRYQHQHSPTPPGQFSQLPPHTTHGYSPDQSVYFLPPPPAPPTGFSPYPTGGFEVYQYPSFPPPPLYPPVPHPVSQLPFPLDHTRYYLLGQLEYYLSTQNMAQDFYLRQQMNPEGWISIPLLASFNRIRQLTPDPQLVRDVLTLSSVAEVSGDWVRMSGNQWTQFVLPPPTPSTSQSTPPETAVAQENVEEDGGVDEEDDDDVEFVMSQEHGNPSWTS